ncbi:MAG: alpha/beta hydrolase [Gammaproteobacteria bacterium]|jgi:fermentation-respiration switch protein FrsA (DUF1100 family)
MTLQNLVYLLFLVAVTYGAFALYLFIMQPRLLYYPDMPGREPEATPAAVGLAYEDVALQTVDNIRLHAWFIPAEKPRATVLFCHGNAGNISHRLDSIRLLHSLGLQVLIFDYRGYGKSEGSPSEKGTYRDVDAAWHYLRDLRGLAEAGIIIFGRSLGAAVAADLASRTRPAAVILESAFTSVPDMAAEFYPWLPVRLLSRYRYDNLGKVARIARPLLLVHSRQDEIIPFAHGERLFGRAREPKQFLELTGGHNDAFQSSRKAYTHGLKSFLDTHLGN